MIYRRFAKVIILQPEVEEEVLAGQGLQDVSGRNPV